MSLRIDSISVTLGVFDDGIDERREVRFDVLGPIEQDAPLTVAIKDAWQKAYAAETQALAKGSGDFPYFG